MPSVKSIAVYMYSYTWFLLYYFSEMVSSFLSLFTQISPMEFNLSYSKKVHRSLDDIFHSDKGNCMFLSKPGLLKL